MHDQIINYRKLITELLLQYSDVVYIRSYFVFVRPKNRAPLSLVLHNNKVIIPEDRRLL